MAIRVKTVNYCLNNMVGDSGGVNKCWIFNNSTWANETTDINSAATNDVPLATAVGSAFYFGKSTPFLSIGFLTQTAPAGGAIVWEYYNGSTWSTLTSLGTTTMASLSTNYWSLPANWATTQVNSEVDGPWYYIRIRVTTLRTTAGSLSCVSIGNILQFSTNRPIEIPETISRTIQSVILRLYEQTSELASIENKALLGRFDSNSYTNLIPRYTTGNQWARTESTGYFFDIDITSLANSSLSASTLVTFDAYTTNSSRGSAGGVYRKNAQGELLITYSFDDTFDTQLNTIILPIDSNTGNLTTSLTTLGGTSAFPALLGSNGVIKEQGVVIKNMYLTFFANAVEGGTTDWSFAAALDNNSETTLATFDANNDSDYFVKVNMCLSAGAGIDLYQSHDVKCRVTSLTGAGMPNCGALLTITYSFSNSATSYYTHTDIIPWDTQLTKVGGLTYADYDFGEKVFYNQATSATFIRGGMLNYFYQNADPGNLILQYGTQTTRSYSVPAATVSGPTPIIQRYDSGGVAGSGINFVKGKNVLQCRVGVSTNRANAGSLTGVMYNTYSYLKESKRHSTAMYIACPQPSFINAQQNSGEMYVYIPEENYYIHSLGLEIHDSTNDTYSTKNLKIKKNDNEGWVNSNGVFTGLDLMDGTRIIFSLLGDKTKRYPQQPFITSGDDVVDLVNNIKTTSLDGVNAKSSAIVWVNWHDYSWSTDITIENSDGGLVQVCIRDILDNKPILHGTRTGNGNITFLYYDNTRDVIATSMEGTTKTAQSLPFKMGD